MTLVEVQREWLKKVTHSPILQLDFTNSPPPRPPWNSHTLPSACHTSHVSQKQWEYTRRLLSIEAHWRDIVSAARKMEGNQNLVLDRTFTFFAAGVGTLNRGVSFYFSKWGSFNAQKSFFLINMYLKALIYQFYPRAPQILLFTTRYIIIRTYFPWQSYPLPSKIPYCKLVPKSCLILMY